MSVVDDIFHTPSLTKREYYAAQAIPGAIRKLTEFYAMNDPRLADSVAEACVKVADAMIAKLEG